MAAKGISNLKVLFSSVDNVKNNSFSSELNIKINELTSQLKNTTDSDNYSYLIIISSEPETTEITSENNVAILYKDRDSDIINILYNSDQNYLKSRRNSEIATNSEVGLMSNLDYELLRNLDEKLNIDKASSMITEDDETLKNILDVSEKNGYKVYTLKNITNLVDINEKINELSERVSSLESFFNIDDLTSSFNQYSNIDDYIQHEIEKKIDDITNNYLNHTHSN